MVDPPLSYSVSAGLGPANQTVLAAGNVTISDPYDAATANDVVLRIGNLTDVTLEARVEARYVRLTIEGSFLGDARGGTVAEFAVL